MKIVTIIVFGLLMLTACNKNDFYSIEVTNNLGEKIILRIDDDHDLDVEYLEAGETYTFEANANKGSNGVLIEASYYSLNHFNSLIDEFTFSPSNYNDYSYEVGSGEVLDENGDQVNDPGTSLIITGKWMRTGGCSNVLGERNYYQFYSNGTGYFFASDCNSQCTGNGIKFYFNYKVYIDGTIEVDNTSVSSYCGTANSTPSDNTLTFYKAGTEITINGSDYTKQ